MNTDQLICACDNLEWRRVLRDFIVAGTTGEALKPEPAESTD